MHSIEPKFEKCCLETAFASLPLLATAVFSAVPLLESIGLSEQGIC